MRRPEYDAVIAGGGLSGLSLAAHLASGPWRDRAVLVVDDPTDEPAALCWGSWSSGRGLLDAAAARTYGRVRIHADGTARVLPLHPYRYQLVRRPDLSRVVTGLLDACPRFELMRGRVHCVRDAGDAAEVVIDGRTVRALWAFDSVTARAGGARVDARLAFTGWEVRSERPVFDALTPVLFDFRTPQSGGARFVYVLPDDAHRALVELTEFVPRSARPAPPTARRSALAEYLSDILRCRDYEILRSESAILPLRAAPTARDPGRVLAIGARAGLIKASTGYAYQRIQRDSEAIAASLARRGHPFGVLPPRRRYPLLDATLLDVLDRDPAQLERAFGRLFAANPAERVLRFLDEDTGLRDDLRLMASLPPAPYLRAMFARGHATGLFPGRSPVRRPE